MNSTSVAPPAAPGLGEQTLQRFLAESFEPNEFSLVEAERLMRGMESALAASIIKPEEQPRVISRLSALMKRFSLRPRVSAVWSWMGVLAGLISFVAVCVQITYIVQRKSACDISYTFLAGNLVTNTLWLMYGVGNRLVVNVLTSSIGLLVVVTLIVMKWYYDRDGHCQKRSK